MADPAAVAEDQPNPAAVAEDQPNPAAVVQDQPNAAAAAAVPAISFQRCICKYNGSPRTIICYDSIRLRTPYSFVPLYDYVVLTDPPDPAIASDQDVELSEDWKRRITKRLRAAAGRKIPSKDLLKAYDVNYFVNVRLQPSHTKSTQDFEDVQDDKTRIFISICKKLGIKILHGSLEDPQDPKNCDGQLTSFGLRSLTDQIEDEELVLLFLKDRLNVVRKYRGSLFLLETNVRCWNMGTDLSPMWRTLCLNEHEVVLFTCTFDPLDMDLQPNSQENNVVQFIEQWKEDRAKERDEINQLLADSEESKPKGKRGRGGGSKGKPAVGEGQISVAAETGGQLADDEAQGSEAVKTAGQPVDDDSQGSTTEKGKSSAKTTGQPPDDPYVEIKDRFTFFLETFIDPEDVLPDGSNSALYVRMVEELRSKTSVKRSNIAKIDFQHIQKEDPVLALAILYDRTRLNDVLSEVFMEFRVKHRCGKEHELKGKIRLRFTNMPSADSLPQCFSVFLASNNIQLSQLETLYDNTTLCSLSYVGRIAGKGYVDDIIDNHRNGKSWNGQFTREDMVIKNGQFQIHKDATVAANSDNMAKDFLTLIDLLFDLYKIKPDNSPDEEEKSPAYFDVFQSEVVSMMGLYDTDLKKFKVFQRYLSNHLAFKLPLVRSALLREAWRVIQALRQIIPSPTSKFRRDQFNRLLNGVKEFRAKACTAWEFIKVYEYENGIGPHDKYQQFLAINFLEFLRHVDEHLLDHTRDERGVQKIVDIAHVDLMIGHTYEKEVSDLVFQMMQELSDAPFSSVWEHYEMVESGDKLKKTLSGSGNENEQSGDLDSSASGSRQDKNVQPGDVENSASGSGRENLQSGDVENSASGSGKDVQSGDVGSSASGSVVNDAAENTCSASGNAVQSGGVDNCASVSGEIKGVAANTTTETVSEGENNVQSGAKKRANSREDESPVEMAPNANKLMGFKIYTREIHSSYAARIDNFRRYDAFSKEVIQRWTYPMVPDVLSSGNYHEMGLHRQEIYKASGSVIGEACGTEKNILIHGSYILDNVITEDGCKMSNSLVYDVDLRAGPIVEPGCILSFKIKVGKNVVIPAYSEVSLLDKPSNSNEDSDEELEYADTNSGVTDSPSFSSTGSNANHPTIVCVDDDSGASEVGTSGVLGYIWASGHTGIQEWRQSIAPIIKEKLQELQHAVAVEDDDGSGEDLHNRPSAADRGNESEMRVVEDDDYTKFEIEVEESFVRALDGVHQYNLIIEINMLRPKGIYPAYHQAIPPHQLSCCNRVKDPSTWLCLDGLWIL